MIMVFNSQGSCEDNELNHVMGFEQHLAYSKYSIKLTKNAFLIVAFIY